MNEDIILASFCEKYINNISDIIPDVKFLTNKEYSSKKEISFEIPCQLNILHEYDDSDSFAYECDIIDTKLNSLFTFFNFPSSIKENFNYVDITNYNNINKKPFKFTYTENDFVLTVKVKSYFKNSNNEDSFLHFFITIKR